MVAWHYIIYFFNIFSLEKPKKGSFHVNLIVLLHNLKEFQFDSH